MPGVFLFQQFINSLLCIAAEMIFKSSILLITFFIIACNNRNTDKSVTLTGKKKIQKKEKHSIAILPFRDVDSSLIKELKAGLQKQLTVEVAVLDNTPLPAFAFYKPRQRYIADSLLIFLRQANKNKFEKIIGITEKDISTKKGDIVNWGILGLGTCPGEACVISTFRAGKNKVSDSIFLRRMITLALHELGHTYGLEHCPIDTCLMKDADGKMNLDDGDSYCEKCRKYLHDKDILK
jgi:archaemetzincin